MEPARGSVEYGLEKGVELLGVLREAAEVQTQQRDLFRNVLRMAAGWFGDYAKHHFDKGQTDKGERNRRRAAFLQQVADQPTNAAEFAAPKPPFIDLPVEDIHKLAEQLAAQVGYVLTPEPEHPDSPPAMPMVTVRRDDLLTALDAWKDGGVTADEQVTYHRLWDAMNL